MDVWIKNPFVISSQSFNYIDWGIFTKIFNDLAAMQSEINEKSVKALISYAHSIDFFTNDEFDDLEFLLLSIELEIKKSVISSFVVNYRVTEDENTKIPWKDVYGIWEVHFRDFEIVETKRL